MENAGVETSGQREALAELSGLIQDLRRRLVDLESALDQPESEYPLDAADQTLRHVVPAMEAVRASVDAIEKIVARDIWPVADYNDLLSSHA
ncbi:MAG: hypothetical protein KatS3mg103_0372 [Phycisphaerales bacterium]|nr:MAG: hypothetical protein KatS3mg103_0372 [Phycisphaerales bacterium]